MPIGLISSRVSSLSHRAMAEALPPAAQLIQRVCSISSSYPVQPSLEVSLMSDTIIIWVPGTNSHSVHPEFLKYVQRYIPSSSVHLSDYMASWDFAESVKNGVENLRTILDHVLRTKRKNQRVMLAGESQGAWVISEVLKDKKYYQKIDRAVLLGHPAVADTHFYNDKKILEINDPKDISAYNFKTNKKELVSSVEKLAKADLTSLPFLFKFVIQNPVSVPLLGALALAQVPVIGHIFNRHDYTDEMHLAALWLNSRT